MTAQYHKPLCVIEASIKNIIIIIWEIKIAQSLSTKNVFCFFLPPYNFIQSVLMVPNSDFM